MLLFNDKNDERETDENDEREKMEDRRFNSNS